MTFAREKSAYDPKWTSSQREPGAPGRHYMQKKRVAPDE
jgi:hypothetical protein